MRRKKSPGMCWLPIDIQLIVLIVVNEATTFLEYREVSVVSLREQVQVIPMIQLRPYFDRLPIRGMELPQRVDIRPVVLLPSLTQPDLRFTQIALQVVMHDIEVLERGEFRVGLEGYFDEELALLGVDVEPVSGVDADFLADAGDEAVHLLVEIAGVVDHVEVGMADPRRGRVVVQLSRELHAFGTASVVL